MSIESDFYTVLSGVCPRVYPDVAPNDALLPYITWQQIGGTVISPLANEVPDKRNANIQVTVWAKTRAEANSIALQCEAALIGAAQFIARPLGALVGSVDEDVDVRGTSQDFSVWAAR